MRILITLLTLSFIVVSCTKGDSKVIDECGEQYFKILFLLDECNVDENNSSFYDEYQESMNYCSMYQVVPSDTNDLCWSNLESLTCSDMSEFETLEELYGIEGCFNFPKKTKREACIKNYKNYCSSSFYECGETALKGVCEEAKNIYGSSESREISFDESKFNNLCKTRTDANEDMEIEDFFSQTCLRYRDNLECSSVPEFDFRNDDWKTQCVD